MLPQVEGFDEFALDPALRTDDSYEPLDPLQIALASDLGLLSEKAAAEIAALCPETLDFDW